MLKDRLMRLHRWLGPLLGVFAVIARTESSLAQQPFGPGAGMMPGPGMSGSAAIDPAGGYYQFPGGSPYPNYYQPWPAVSPYEVDYGQTAIENGLWQYDNMSHAGLPAHWRFKTEYVRTQVKSPQGYIGNRNAQTYKEQVLPLLRQAPYSLTTLADAFEGTNLSPGYNYFDPVEGREIGNPYTDGIRLTLDALNVDGSGLEIVGSWSFGDDNRYDAKEQVFPNYGIPELVRNSERLKLIQFYDPGQVLNAGPGGISNVVVFRPPTTGQQGQGQGGGNQTGVAIPVGGYEDISQALAVTLKNLRGIPLDDGTVQIGPDGEPFGGASAVYDLNFRIDFKVQQYGAGLRWNTAPWIKTDSFRLTPMVGLRYMNLREQFTFFGQHSGLIYDNLAGGVAPNPDVLLHSLPDLLDNNRDGLIDPAGAVEGGQGAGGGGGGGAGGTGRFIYPANQQLFPITSYLTNVVESNMLGPELGVSYVWGGEQWHIGGRTNVSLLANLERLRMEGDNIFVTTRESNLIQPSANDPSPNDFTDSENSGHVSPMLEQNIFFDGPILRYVPLLKRWSVTRNANVSFGYTHTLIAEVSRPDETILWRGNPAAGIFPEIKPKRSSWHSNSFNFGLSWNW